MDGRSLRILPRARRLEATEEAGAAEGALGYRRKTPRPTPRAAQSSTSALKTTGGPPVLGSSLPDLAPGAKPVGLSTGAGGDGLLH